MQAAAKTSGHHFKLKSSQEHEGFSVSVFWVLLHTAPQMHNHWVRHIAQKQYCRGSPSPEITLTYQLIPHTKQCQGQTSHGVQKSNKNWSYENKGSREKPNPSPAPPAIILAPPARDISVFSTTEYPLELITSLIFLRKKLQDKLQNLVILVISSIFPGVPSVTWHCTFLETVQQLHFFHNKRKCHLLNNSSLALSMKSKNENSMCKTALFTTLVQRVEYQILLTTTTGRITINANPYTNNTYRKTTKYTVLDTVAT